MVDSAGDQQLEVLDHMKKEHTDSKRKSEFNLKGCRLKYISHFSLNSLNCIIFNMLISFRGYLEVNKVKGEFHVAFGRQAEANPDAGSYQQVCYKMSSSILLIRKFHLI